MSDIKNILDQAVEKIKSAQDLLSLENIQVYYLGKKGVLTEQLKNLSKLSAEDRPKVGQELNQLKNQIQDNINQQKILLKEHDLKDQLSQDKIDITLPGRGYPIGNLHPITRTRERLQYYFEQLGFVCVDGPEVEDDFHNFTAL